MSIFALKFAVQCSNRAGFTRYLNVNKNNKFLGKEMRENQGTSGVVSSKGRECLERKYRRVKAEPGERSI